MGYRKFAADQLFTGYAMLGKDWVLITSEKGKVQDIVPASDAGESIERFNGILTPGFINCHCHIELSHMKGMIPQRTGMVKFLLTVMNSRKSPEEEIQQSIEQAEAYMLQKGIVAAGDICNTADSISQKKKGNIYYHNFIEATGFVEATANSRFAQAHDLYLKFLSLNRTENSLPLTSSIVPHAPYSVSNRLMELINNHEQGSLLSLHNQESEDEIEFFASGKGQFLELYKSLGIQLENFTGAVSGSLVHCLKRISPSHSLILVHNVHTGRGDLRLMSSLKQSPQLFWCLCPNANLYINGRLPDVRLLLDHNCKLVVGTDSLASNVQLNILEELKTLQENIPGLDTAELLKWATSNGAEALRIENRYGSFEKGKIPGIVVIDGGRDGLLAGSVSKRVL